MNTLEWTLVGGLAFMMFVVPAIAAWLVPMPKLVWRDKE